MMTIIFTDARLTVLRLGHTMNAPVQLDMLPLVDAFSAGMETNRPQVRKPRKLTPGTCILCGQPAWDHYKYSDAEFSACYVAHHGDWKQCVRFVLRRGGTYEQN